MTSSRAWRARYGLTDGHTSRGLAVPLELNARALRGAIRIAPEAMRQSMTFRFREIGRFYEDQAVRRFSAKLSGPFRQNTHGSRLANRTGALRRSLQHSVEPRGASDIRLAVSIGNARTADYVHAQEEGAVITSKKPDGKLTIPMPANLTATGVPRYASARQVQGLFKVTSKKGNEFLVRKKGDDGELEFLWMLKDRVRIPPRLGFVRGWTLPKVTAYRADQINRGVRQALRSVGFKP